MRKRITFEAEMNKMGEYVAVVSADGITRTLTPRWLNNVGATVETIYPEEPPVGSLIYSENNSGGFMVARRSRIDGQWAFLVSNGVNRAWREAIERMEGYDHGDFKIVEP
jgi:hypothetical protein